MAQDISLTLDSKFVRPLGEAQSEMIQVLLSSFTVRRNGPGFQLEVDFDYDTQAIWLKRGKGHVRSKLDPIRTAEKQNQFRQLLIEGTLDELPYSDPAYPFRFGNGGTLPVIRIDRKDYYCLFYRDVHPVGWNIANGGAESVNELLDPAANIQRELHEELIVADPSAGIRYVFDWTEGRASDHPEFAIARKAWGELFRERDFARLREETLPLKWLRGQDSVLIRFEGQEQPPVTGCLLNINAEDFGIEIDRVAKLSASPEAVFCDGEVTRGKLLNQIVGLFEVDYFNARMAAGRREFFPQRIYWYGRDRSGDDPRDLVKLFLADLVERRIRTAEDADDWEAAALKFGLCPATDTVIRRYLAMEEDEPPPQNLLMEPVADNRGFEIFLCFSSECREVARKVYDFFGSKGRRVFFSDEELHTTNFGREIDAALASCCAMIVIGLQRAHLEKRNVEFEWRTFHQDILGMRKPQETPIITVTEETDLYSLPRRLAENQVLRWDPAAPNRTLEQLAKFIP